jgi:hypothetical protein
MAISPIRPVDDFSSLQVQRALPFRGRRGTPPAVFPAPLRVHERHVAKNAGLHELQHVRVERIRAALEASLKHDAAGVFRRGRDRAGVFHGIGERRLAVDALARLQRRERDLTVTGRRRGNDDRVEVRRIEQPAPVRYRYRGGVRCVCGRALQEGFVDVADPPDHGGFGPPERVENLAAPRPESDEPESDRWSRSRLARGRLRERESLTARQQRQRPGRRLEELASIEGRIHCWGIARGTSKKRTPATRA